MSTSPQDDFVSGVILFFVCIPLGLVVYKRQQKDNPMILLGNNLIHLQNVLQSLQQVTPFELYEFKRSISKLYYSPLLDNVLPKHTNKITSSLQNFQCGSCLLDEVRS